MENVAICAGNVQERESPGKVNLPKKRASEAMPANRGDSTHRDLPVRKHGACFLVTLRGHPGRVFAQGA